MALSVGQQVAYAVPIAATAYELRDGNFVFGVVSAVTGADTDVLWSNGTFSEGITSTNALDLIVPFVSPLAGKMVSFGTANTAQYYGILVRTYTRQLNGADPAAVAFALIRLVNTGQLVEVLNTLVAAVTGQ